MYNNYIINRIYVFVSIEYQLWFIHVISEVGSLMHGDITALTLSIFFFDKETYMFKLQWYIFNANYR